MKRIRWDVQERTAIYNRLVELYSEGKFSSRDNILRAAQSVLPPERRRKIYPVMLYKLKDWMESARIESYNAARDRKLTQVAAASKPTPVEEPSLSDLLDKLVDQLAKRVATEVMLNVSQYLSAPQKVKPNDTFQREQPVAEVSPIDTTSKPAKSKRMRVTVIGLKGQQMSAVERKHPDIDFTFMDTEEAKSRSAVEGECTILMTRFINHAAYKKYRQAPNMKHCNGGVSDLSTIIYAIRNS
jgi:hypothetical protein